MKTKAMLYLSKLNKNETDDSRGGYSFEGDEFHACGCGCYYAGSGGSSTQDNKCANYNGDLASPQQ